MRSSYPIWCVLLAIGGCSGSAEPAVEAPPPAPIAEPPPVAERPPEVVVDLTSERVGEALRLDVSARAIGVGEDAAFETPDRWRISAQQAGVALDRLVNGSVEVARHPHGKSRWDTVVRFSLVFQVRGDAPVEVRLVPPGGAPIVRSIANP
jgi:hypothetical protein